MKQTCKESWAGNLLMWTDLALGPSFKGKQWFTGFSELSSAGYNLASVLRCTKSSL